MTAMRVISHTCSNTEIICELGAEHCLVGVDDHSDHPPEVVDRLPRIGPDLDFDIDKVLDLKPDLVITSMTLPGHERNIEQLIRHQVPHVVMQPESLEDVARDIRTIADLLDCTERGDALAEQFLRAMDDPGTTDDESPRILVEWWPKPVIIPGRRSWVTPMLACAGAINPLADEEVESRPVSDDELARINPDAIVIAWCGVPFEKYRPEVVRRRACLSESTAVQRDQIYCISEAYLGRPGPRLIHGLTQLREIVERIR